MPLVTIQLGSLIRAKCDHIHSLGDGREIELWRKNQLLRVGGIFQPGDIETLEFLVALDDLNYENVPAPLMPIFFHV